MIFFHKSKYNHVYNKFLIFLLFVLNCQISIRFTCFRTAKMLFAWESYFTLQISVEENQKCTNEIIFSWVHRILALYSSSDFRLQQWLHKQNSCWFYKTPAWSLRLRWSEARQILGSIPLSPQDEKHNRALMASEQRVFCDDGLNYTLPLRNVMVVCLLHSLLDCSSSAPLGFRHMSSPTSRVRPCAFDYVPICVFLMHQLVN